MTTVSAELRRAVRQRARNCCEYCLIPQSEKFFPFEVDHIIASKHDGDTTLNNLCLACRDCNVYKGSDISSTDPISGAILPLFNPRQQHWNVHFQLEGAFIVPLTATGRVTVKLLNLNDTERLEERAEMIESGVYPPFPVL